MYLKIPGQNITIKEYKKLKERFVSLKFYLYPIDFGICFPKKKYFSTSFFCQRVDLCFTDNDYKILYLHSNVKSEKRFLHLKSKNVFVFPVGTNQFFEVGDTLRIRENEKKD